MFTGIVHGCYPVSAIKKGPASLHFGIKCPEEISAGLTLGASVAVDGVCLTVCEITGSDIFFDVMQETLNLTTLDTLSLERRVNIERSARIGDEIGGHLLSGHVIGTVTIADIEATEDNKRIVIQAQPEWMPYILNKGYIALDGASLTVCKPDSQLARFEVNLIPETIKRTTLGFKTIGERINLEIDAQTQAIVETVRKSLRGLAPQ